MTKRSWDIEQRKSSGELFKVCPSCGFEAQKYQPEEKIVYHADCLVCELSEKSSELNVLPVTT